MGGCLEGEFSVFYRGCIVMSAEVYVIVVYICILQTGSGIAVLSAHVNIEQVKCVHPRHTYIIYTLPYTFLSTNCTPYIVHHYILVHPALCGCLGQGAYVARKVPHCLGP